MPGDTPFDAAGRIVERSPRPCPDCDGTGWLAGDPCPLCSGLAPGEREDARLKHQRAVEKARHAAPSPTPFDAALAALDVEAVDRKDSGVTVHEIVGLDDVRAAHRAEVDAAVKAEREACAALVRPERFGTRECSCDTLAEDVAAAIRARGAKP